MFDPISELEQLTKEEIRGFEIYRRKSATINPPPQKPNPVKQGWEFKAYFVVCVAAVLLASMRTAEQFYRAATFSANAVLGFTEAFLAVFTVESGIVVYAAVLAARQKKIAQWVMWLGIILLSSISIVAGLGQSLYLSRDIDPIILRYTEYALSILIGPGASIAALIGGHILGQQIASAAMTYESMLAEYDHKIKEYNERIIRNWTHSRERRIVLGLMPAPIPPSTLIPEIKVLQPGETSKIPEKMPVVQTVTQLKGDNNRPIQQPQVIKPVARNPQAEVRIDQNSARAVTQWLVANGKTPFDADINPMIIAEDANIHPNVVRTVLLRMRNNTPIRE
jgi:hypothetical protein